MLRLSMPSFQTLDIKTIIKICKTLLLIIVLVSGCSSSESPPPAAPPATELSVMTFNIEWGGANVSFENVVEAIRISKTDVVGVQEADGNLERLATALDWNYDQRNYVISRFPLIDPPGANGKYVFVEVTPGNVVAIANLHLPSDPYGPDLMRDGTSLHDVLETEEITRMPMLRGYLEKLPELIDNGIPTFVTGDFNSPSHTDWTAHSFGDSVDQNFAVAWPATLAMSDAGFKDTWRTLHPDAAAMPGHTWWAGRPPLEAYSPGENDAQVRIDYVWFAGPAQPSSIFIVGEEHAPDVSLSVMPWPSDHRGVVASFETRPVPLPNLMSSDRRIYTRDDNIQIIYQFAGENDLRISMRNATTDELVLEERPSLDRGVLEYPDAVPGYYIIEATTDLGTQKRELWVLNHELMPSIEVSGIAFAMGEAINVNWNDAPGNRNDYIALYRLDAWDHLEAMLTYVYVEARPQGSLDLSTAELSDGYALQPGSYAIRLMKDDSYEVLAESASFEIR